MFTTDMSFNIIIGIVVLLVALVIAISISLFVKHKKAKKSEELCQQRIQKIKSKI